MNAEEIITGQPVSPETPVIVPADLAALSADVNKAVTALQNALIQFNTGITAIVDHARVLADGQTAGHFKMGMGFEFDPVTGTHNVNGTADYKADIAELATTLGDELRTADATLSSTLSDVQAILTSKADAAVTQTALDGKAPVSHGTHVTYGTTASTCCQGNDARLSNSRAPTAHTHTIANTTGLQAGLDKKVDITALTRLTWAGLRPA